MLKNLPFILPSAIQFTTNGSAQNIEKRSIGTITVQQIESTALTDNVSKDSLRTITDYARRAGVYTVGYDYVIAYGYSIIKGEVLLTEHVQRSNINTLDQRKNKSQSAISCWDIQAHATNGQIVYLDSFNLRLLPALLQRDGFQHYYIQTTMI